MYTAYIGYQYGILKSNLVKTWAILNCDSQTPAKKLKQPKKSVVD